MSEHACFFAAREDAGPCSGRLVKGHLVPRSLLRREFRWGCVYEAGSWWRLERGEETHGLPFKAADDLIEDPRSWAPMCGGINGSSAHHGQFDGYQLGIAREDLPAAVEQFAAELGLGWWLDRRYGTCGGVTNTEV